MWDGRHFVIRARRADNDGRQRFSCAHGIIHIYFMESGSVPRAGGIALDSWSRQEEDLCDQGAAELPDEAAAVTGVLSRLHSGL